MEYNIQIADDELAHHGTKGMRWGVRRYQNKDGSLTPAGKKRYDKEMDKIKAETKKIRNQQRTAAKLSKLEAARKNLEDLKNGKDKSKDDKDTKTAEETDEQKRERILQKPTAKDVYENRHLFSNKEVGDLYLRLNNEENIKRLVPKEVDPKKAKADEFVEKVGDLTTKAITLGKAYNLAATVYNAFSGTDKVSLPKLDLDSLNKGNKETRKQEKKKAKEEEKKAKEEKQAKEAEEKARKAEQKQAKAAEKQAKKEAENGSGDTKAKQSNKEKVYEGTVEGVGNSSKTSTQGKKWTNDSTVIDAEYWEVVNDSSTSAGRSYASNYLNSGRSTLALPAPGDDD